MNLLKHTVATAAISAAIAGAAFSAEAASVKATMDSTQIVMGNVAVVKFDIVKPADSPAQLVADMGRMPKEVEVASWVDGDTTDIGNGLVEIRRGVVLQSFDSGAYVIPPFLLVNGPDTVRSNELRLKVNPVDVSQMKDINPIANIAKFQTKWYDWLPDWITDYWLWILLGLLIVAGGICGYLMVTRKVAVNILPQKKRLPPDVIALNRLDRLKEAQLWEKGQEKEYYTQLVDILRDYLQERFGINAMEMTSTQILKALHSNEETRMPQRHMKRIVDIADYVKFAKVRPVPDDNVRAFIDARNFIEETRPVVQPEEDGKDANAAGEGKPSGAASQPSESTKQDKK